jgi:hypothetical protein
VKVHYDEGIANHIDPEPCAGIREDVGEASVGEHAGQPLSRERTLSRVPTPLVMRKATWVGAITRVPIRPGVVVDPGMYGRPLHGNREISVSAILPPGDMVRNGKARSRSR